MPLKISGLMAPPKLETFVWFFDDAIDQDKSDFLAWSEDPSPSSVVLRDEAVQPTKFHWMPLDSDVRDIIFRLQQEPVEVETSPVPLSQNTEQAQSFLRMVRVYQSLAVTTIVAYGVESIEGFDVPFTRDPSAAGPKVSKKILRALKDDVFTRKAKILVPVPEGREIEEGQTVEESEGKRFYVSMQRVRLMDSLASHIWAASLPTEQEKKA